jgi:hypothetical protein
LVLDVVVYIGIDVIVDSGIAALNGFVVSPLLTPSFVRSRSRSMNSKLFNNGLDRDGVGL